MSKTISIVIPDSLETDLQRAADDLSITRSRYISTILLNWKENRDKELNIPCDHLVPRQHCNFFNTPCHYLPANQTACVGYCAKESI